MHFLIQTDRHARPYLTTVAFIARDFQRWGCRVSCHHYDSSYIAEIRAREKKMNQTEFRIGLMEIWAQETISQKRQAQDRLRNTHENASPIEHLTPEDQRLEKATSLAEDFVNAISALDKPGVKQSFFPIDPRPIPPAPYSLITKHMRLLHTVRYTSNAILPPWAGEDIVIADQITFELRYHEVLKQEHLTKAIDQVVCKNLGRAGRVERCKVTGLTKVIMLVDVSDCVLSEFSSDKNEETIDPVPMYERGEHPPVYEVVSR